MKAKIYPLSEVLITAILKRFLFCLLVVLFINESNAEDLLIPEKPLCDDKSVVSKDVIIELKDESISIGVNTANFSYPAYCSIDKHITDSSVSYIEIWQDTDQRFTNINDTDRSNVKIFWYTDGTNIFDYIKENIVDVEPLALNNEMTLYERYSFSSDSLWTNRLQVFILSGEISLIVQLENRNLGDADLIFYTIVDSIVKDATPLLPRLSIPVSWELIKNDVSGQTAFEIPWLTSINDISSPISRSSFAGCETTINSSFYSMHAVIVQKKANDLLLCNIRSTDTRCLVSSPPANYVLCGFFCNSINFYFQRENDDFQLTSIQILPQHTQDTYDIMQKYYHTMFSSTKGGIAEKQEEAYCYWLYDDWSIIVLVRHGTENMGYPSVIYAYVDIDDGDLTPCDVLLEMPNIF